VFSVLELPKGVKPKMRERKLRNGVNWQGALKQNDVKHRAQRKSWVTKVYPLRSVK
jgi:hypothetical protein